MSFVIITVQMDFDTVCIQLPCLLLLTCWGEAPVHQQPAIWHVLKFFTVVKWPVVQFFKSCYSHWINVGTYMVNHDHLIRLSLISLYIRLTIMTMILAMWTALIPYALVPHRYQTIRSSRFTRFTNVQWFIYAMYVPRHRWFDFW